MARRNVRRTLAAGCAAGLLVLAACESSAPQTAPITDAPQATASVAPPETEASPQSSEPAESPTDSPAELPAPEVAEPADVTAQPVISRDVVGRLADANERFTKRVADAFQKSGSYPTAARAAALVPEAAAGSGNARKVKLVGYGARLRADGTTNLSWCLVRTTTVATAGTTDWTPITQNFVQVSDANLRGPSKVTAADVAAPRNVNRCAATASQGWLPDMNEDEKNLRSFVTKAQSAGPLKAHQVKGLNKTLRPLGYEVRGYGQSVAHGQKVAKWCMAKVVDGKLAGYAAVALPLEHGRLCLVGPRAYDKEAALPESCKQRA